jgi:hypothetical protein
MQVWVRSRSRPGKSTCIRPPLRRLLGSERAQRIAQLSEDIDERIAAYAGILWRRRRERPPTRP